MPARLACPAALLAFALLVPATGAAAKTHHATPHHSGTHHAASHHTASRHTASHHVAKKSAGRHDAKSADRHAAAPGGATSVPGTGLKLFCPARKNPLLIRKATQGAGTTVTVVCR